LAYYSTGPGGPAPPQPQVIRWTELGAVNAPDGGCVRLMQRGAEFSITLDGAELMNSRRGGSEAALAVEACKRLRGRTRVDVVIGGLGMGFTLRAALAELGPSATITVVELLPEMLEWAAGPLATVFQASLADPRLRLVQGDVGEYVADRTSAYDAIILDVDNGPDGLVRPANGRLYSEDGLAVARRALRPGGVLAVWSASPAPAFVQRLYRSGFHAEDVLARSAATRGARHVVYVATVATVTRPLPVTGTAR
jgi:spermidine synthase